MYKNSKKSFSNSIPLQAWKQKLNLGAIGGGGVGGDQEPHKSFSLDTDPDEENCNTIAPQLVPVFYILRFFGSYPIIFNSGKPTNSQNQINNVVSVIDGNFGEKIEPIRTTTRVPVYTFAVSRQTISSPVLWYSVTVFLLTILIWIIFILNLGFENYGPVTLLQLRDLNFTSSLAARMGSLLNRMTHMAEGIVKLAESIIILVNIPALLRFLNSWHTFERDFRSTFRGVKKLEVDIKLVRDVLLVVYVGGATVLGTTGFWYGIYPLYKAYSILGYFSLIWVTILVICVSFTEGTKLLLMLWTLREAFRQTKLGILAHAKQGEVMEPETVLKWHNLIHQVRRQGERIGVCVGGQQLIFVLETIVIFTTNFFAIICFVSESREVILENFGFATLCCLIFLNYLIKVYLLILAAETVYQQERELRRELTQMRFRTSNPDVQAELKYLCLTLSQEPCKINFLNYVDLDKKLLLKIFVQVTTYLIVILQFPTNKFEIAPSESS